MDLQNIKETTVCKNYDYILAIDLGTNSTSCSFSHSDNDKDIQTITNWPRQNPANYGGRVASSVLYKQENEDPLWGGAAARPFYNENDDFFYAPQIKLYLTDPDNQPYLPGDTLTPVKLVSDYLKQLHAFCVIQMKDYFEEKNKEDELYDLEVASKEEPPNESNQSRYSITEDQIRYVFSYPDNQGEKYQTQIKKAMENAGIISPEDPSSRLEFVTESEATAYYCLSLTHQIKPSPEPYLVCDVGSMAFSMSTIEAEEILETATISPLIDLNGLGRGTLELDNRMKEYLLRKVTASENDENLLKMFYRRLFNFFIDDIKNTFDESDDYFFNLEEFHDINNTSIESDCIRDDLFVFSCDDLKEFVFDPVTDKILQCIEEAKHKFERGISGIILSGTIGSNHYLKNIVHRSFGTNETKVISVNNSELAVSKGLINYKMRQPNLAIPYFVKKEIKQKSRVMQIGNEVPVFDKTYHGVKTFDHNDVDYIIGLDFGSTYSAFAFAPVPKDGEPRENHPLVIKEIKSWPKQVNGNYAKVPSMLYYDRCMKYTKLFGNEAKRESMKRNADGILLQHFKDLLTRDFGPHIDDKIFRDLDDDAIVRMVTNYIHDFAKEGISRMKRQVSLNEKKLAFVITVPTMWSDEAKNTMKVAVQNANLVDTRSGVSIDDRVVFITEAEAVALYCDRYYRDKFSMDRQQRFMICQAKGTTVEVTTFEVVQEENGDGKILISEITSGDRANCGSVYLDMKFRDYIVEKFLEYNLPHDAKGIENLINQFVQEIKPNFEPAVDPDMEEDITLAIPTVLGIPPDLYDENGFIVDNEIVISYSEMETRVFAPVIENVLALIEKQLRKLPEGERQLDAILMVGGFGQSVYLHKKVVDHFEYRAIGARFVGKPPDGDLAICRGAVSFGLEPRLLADRITRYTYGLQVKDLYRREYDNPDQKVEYKDDQGNIHYYCQNVFSEIVAKETKISKGTLYSLKTFVTYPNDPVFAIYSSKDDGDNLDTRNLIASGLEPICKLTVNTKKIPGIQTKKEGEKIEFEVLVEITGTAILVHILHEENLITEGVTRTSTIVKPKYKLGATSENKNKKSWLNIPIFSLSGGKSD